VQKYPRLIGRAAYTQRVRRRNTFLLLVGANLMEPKQAKHLLTKLLGEIEYPGGGARTDDYSGLRQVDAKVREGRLMIARIPQFGAHLARQMAADADFEATTRGLGRVLPHRPKVSRRRRRPAKHEDVVPAP